MARQINRLTALRVQRETKVGLHPDGGGLYLRVTASGGKFWVLRYMLEGKAREMGLGAVHSVSLAEARQKALDYRKLLSDGVDPISAREAGLKQTRLEALRSKTFKECAESYIASYESSWKNEKHKWQWHNTLERFVYPIMGELPIQEIDTNLVLQVLEPIWQKKTETATRVRGRVELIIDWATSRDYRKGENPARWRGHLKNLLPAPSKIHKVKHLPSLPYQEIGSLIQALHRQEGMAALAMEFAVLTASRTSEVLRMTWDEVDLTKQIWKLSEERMKAGREHRVALSDDAVELLEKHREILKQTGVKTPYVFAGNRGKPMSNMAMLMLLRRMKIKGATVHGFRTTFRVWAAEKTNFQIEVGKAAIAHKTGDKAEEAYQRSDFFEKRRHLMNAWARYCYQPSPKKGEDKVLAGHFKKMGK
jgi:integrase